LLSIVVSRLVYHISIKLPLLLFDFVYWIGQCDSSNPGCGTLHQDIIPRPGENARLYFNHSDGLIKHRNNYVTYWINKTSNDYIAFNENTLTIENVAAWMRGQEYYVQCTTGRDLDKCTQTVALQMKGRPFCMIVFYYYLSYLALFLIRVAMNIISVILIFTHSHFLGRKRITGHFTIKKEYFEKQHIHFYTIWSVHHISVKKKRYGNGMNSLILLRAH